MNQVHREWKSNEAALATKADAILQTLREAENHLVRLHAGQEPRFSTTAMIQRLRIAITYLKRIPTMEEYMGQTLAEQQRESMLNAIPRDPRMPVNDALRGQQTTSFWRRVFGG